MNIIFFENQLLHCIFKGNLSAMKNRTRTLIINNKKTTSISWVASFLRNILYFIKVGLLYLGFIVYNLYE